MVSINLQNIYLNQNQTLKNSQYKNSNDNKSGQICKNRL